MLEYVLAQIAYFMKAGGYVMPPLLACTVVLWYALGIRFALLKRGSQRSVRVLLSRVAREKMKKAPNGILDQAVERGLALKEQVPQTLLRRNLDAEFGPSYEALARGARVISTVVAVAPLLGLLGTVVGMIETFKSLGDMSLFAQSGGIAGGIAQALFTTQMGLAVAIPGVILNGIFNRRQAQMATELDQLKDLLCSEPLERLRTEKL